MKRFRLLWFVIPAMLLGVIPVMASGGTLVATHPAPKLNVSQWVKGGPINLAAGKGKNVYVVEFWATWCPPCRMSIPHLTELQKKFKDKGVVVIGISQEDPATVKAFVKRMGDKMDYTVGVDTKDGATYNAFDKIAPIPGIPWAYVIDKQGDVVWAGSPFDRLGRAVSRAVSSPSASTKS